MLIGWSPWQTSPSLFEPSRYMFDEVVSKPDVGGRNYEVRNPPPELLLGHPAVFQAALRVSKSKLRYRVATLSFAASDIDIESFNSGDPSCRGAVSTTIDLFLATAFAGVPVVSKPPILVGTHTHTRRLEINIAVPRYVINSDGQVRSFNPHPPQLGSQRLWDDLCSYLNQRFGWSDPKSVENQTQIKGPDWAEKRIATANRSGQKFDADVEPRLYLLQSAKEISKHESGTEPAYFMQQFAAPLAMTSYQLCPTSNGKLWLRSETEPPLLLRGALVVGPRTQDDMPTAYSVERDITAAWERRAAYNSEVFSGGQWCEEPPDWAFPEAERFGALPLCHPDHAGTHEPAINLGFASLSTRVTAALKALRKQLNSRMLSYVLSRHLLSLHPKIFGKIKRKLKDLNDDHLKLRHEASNASNDRTFSASSRRVGQTGGSEHRRTDRGNDGGSQRNFGTDDAVHCGDGKDGVPHAGSRGLSSNASTDDRAGGEYSLVTCHAGATSIYRWQLLSALLAARDCRDTGKTARIQMDVNGCFRIVAANRCSIILASGTLFKTSDQDEDDFATLLPNLPTALSQSLLTRNDADAPDQADIPFAP